MRKKVNMQLANEMNSKNPRVLPTSIMGMDFSSNEGITAKEALSQCGGDFKVVKKPFIITNLADDEISDTMTAQEFLAESQISDQFFVTQREDTKAILGVVKSSYEIIQNDKALEFIDLIEKASGEKMQIESAGCFQNGSRVYLSARLGDHCFDGEQEYVNRMVFTTAHDGSNSMCCFFSPIRVYCLNTLNVAIKKCQNKLSYIHTKSSVESTDWTNEENLDRAIETFEKSVKFTDTFRENMRFFGTQEIKEEYVKNFIQEVLYGPELKKKDSKFDLESQEAQAQIQFLRNSIEFGVAQDMCKTGTKEWLLNGVTTHLHNSRDWRTPEAEFKSLNFGDGQKMAQRAYDYLMAV